MAKKIVYFVSYAHEKGFGHCTLEADSAVDSQEKFAELWAAVAEDSAHTNKASIAILSIQRLN